MGGSAAESGSSGTTRGEGHNAFLHLITHLSSLNLFLKSWFVIYAYASAAHQFLKGARNYLMQPSSPSRAGSVSTAWSTTHQPDELEVGNGEGEVVQDDAFDEQPLGHGLDAMVGQEPLEEGFGDYDPTAAPDSPRSTGSSAVDDESGVVCGGSVVDSEDKEDIISMPLKRRRILE
ncbi:uncharacterized protein LOC125526026 [Triticum urartu]|uniref:uncharacterized protein LOC125526026 n=1 Tax=Triticum urartu TaxID=4572 RepID=UPI0020435E8D|nr:uncharacterized protein LOC125526026 [Triticum urartu]